METYRLICLLIVITMTIFASMNAQQTNDDRTMERNIVVWGTIHVTTTEGEHDDYFVNYEFIKASPIEIKTIIAFFSSYYAQEDIEFANALGNFESLREAEKSLLQNKGYYFKDIQVKEVNAQWGDSPANFVIYIQDADTDTLVTVKFYGIWGSSFGAYIFKIKRDGSIEYIR